MGNEKLVAVPHDSKHAEMEKLAATLVAEWIDGLAKLKELAPDIKKVEEYFQKHVRGSATLIGCSSFKQFCEKRLKRDRTTVYKMLKNYERESSDGRAKAAEGVPKQPGKRDQLKQELAEAKANVKRLLPVGQAAGKFVEALQSGDEAKKNEAIRELQFTIEATPLTGLNSDDQPNTTLMLHEVLTEIQQVGDRIYAVAPTLVKLANAQIKRLSLHGKIGFVQGGAESAVTVAVPIGKPQALVAQAA
jgi:hypothetical protein